jgi:hypothetical protein
MSNAFGAFQTTGPTCGSCATRTKPSPPSACSVPKCTFQISVQSLTCPDRQSTLAKKIQCDGTDSEARLEAISTNGSQSGQDQDQVKEGPIQAQSASSQRAPDS